MQLQLLTLSLACAEPEANESIPAEPYVPPLDASLILQLEPEVKDWDRDDHIFQGGLTGAYVVASLWTDPMGELDPSSADEIVVEVGGEPGFQLWIGSGHYLGEYYGLWSNECEGPCRNPDCEVVDYAYLEEGIVTLRPGEHDTWEWPLRVEAELSGLTFVRDSDGIRFDAEPVTWTWTDSMQAASGGYNINGSCD